MGPAPRHSRAGLRRKVRWRSLTTVKAAVAPHFCVRIAAQQARQNTRRRRARARTADASGIHGGQFKCRWQIADQLYPASDQNLGHLRAACWRRLRSERVGLSDECKPALRNRRWASEIARTNAAEQIPQNDQN